MNTATNNSNTPISIIPMILSGGSGTRLWPLSTSKKPKQFLTLLGEKTLIKRTYERACAVSDEVPVIIANESHQKLIAAELKDKPYTSLVEPLPRDTGPAIILASLHAQKLNPNAATLLLPADHYIPDVELFSEYVKKGLPATTKYIVTFGIQPNYPETGYGYIETTTEEIVSGCYKVKQFKEKPDQATAENFIKKGNFSWNSGIFLFQPKVLLAEAENYCPGLVNICRESYNNGYIDKNIFSTCPKISIDFCLFECSQKMAVVPATLQWSDIGSYLSLWQLKEKDEFANVIENAISKDVKSSFIKNLEPNKKVVVLGLEDIVVVNTKDAILIMKNDQNSNLKATISNFNK